MYKNYLKIAFRNLAKNKLHASINIFGLAIGFVVAILSILYIKNELSYEKWIPNQEEIYRVYRQAQTQTSGGWVYSPSPLAATLANEIAGIKKATKLYVEEEILFTKEDKAIYIKNVAFVDSSYFDLFPFPFKEGDPNTALDTEHSVVISERVAKLFFGHTSPLGQILKYDGENEYLVTGVLKTHKGNTFLNHEVFIALGNKVPNHWLANRVTTYVRKEKQANIDQIELQTAALLFPIYQKERQASNLPAETRANFPKWKFQPLSEIHLYSDQVVGFRDAEGAVNKLFLFGLIAFIVLLMACINYINLATAKATGRAKEVGIRKVAGAQKKQLIGQFLTESILQSMLALGISIILSEVLLPVFNQITNRNLTFFDGNLQTIILPLLILSLFIGLLAGIYPAFFLTRYKPINVLKGSLLRTSGGQFFRKSLVVAQFSMSVILIILLVFIYKQVDFMQSQELGFEEEQVMVIEINRQDSWKKTEQRKSNFEQISGVKSFAFSNNLPGKENTKYGIKMVGKEMKESPDILFTSENFDEILGLKLLEGRFFSADHSTDEQEAYVVNERFVKEHTIEFPIGQELKFIRDRDNFGRIIGVVKDFHFTGLQDKINPMVITTRKNLDSYKYIAFKLAATHLPSTVEAIKKEWAKIEPTHPVRYSFLDEKFAAQYEENEKFGYTIMCATILTIFIAMLGLFGLVSFMTEQRTKEIGVRKILGASISNLVNLLVKDFIQLVFIAGIIAVPFGYFLVKKWLAGFAYKTTINSMPFILAIVGVVALSILIVSYQSIKVSTANPIKALKVE